MSDYSAVIDLAREPDFTLGALQVSPPTREVSRAGWRDSLEPRVMQVLVALHQAGGAVVSRDALIERCWEGRVVGEDAINRAIGRLRRLSESDGGASFEIETIPRVGYRLNVGTAAAFPTGEAPPPMARPDRRLLLLAGGVIAVTGATGFYLSRRPEPAPRPAPDQKLAMQLEQAKQALRAGNPEAAAQAAGMFEHVTQIAPQTAQAWGGVALAYAYGVHGVPNRSDEFRLRSEDAIRHARTLDPHNAYAYAAQAELFPVRGAWAKRAAILREGLSFNPNSDELLLQMADLLNNCGRNGEAAGFAAKANAAAMQLDPALTWLSIQIYWSASRLAEADAIAAQGGALYPRQRSVWYSRVYLLMYTGRSDEALAILNDRDRRPPGQPDEDFDAVAAVARALKSKARTDIDAALAANLKLAHVGAGYAENAIAFAAALGRLDEAFLVANGLYFNRGFQVGKLRFSPMQQTFTAFQDSRTRTLFYPSSRAMWRDPRFAPLVEEIGLARYWKDAGVTPDYQRAKDI